jgi:hypothetical protein
MHRMNQAVAAVNRVSGLKTTQAAALAAGDLQLAAVLQKTIAEAEKRRAQYLARLTPYELEEIQSELSRPAAASPGRLDASPH